MITLETILGYENMLSAALSVKRNKGAAGIDDMETGDLIKWFYDHPYKLTENIKTGLYKPQPIKRVYIPKPNGEKRPLGISTVIDRTVQVAIANVLRDEFDKQFSDSSHGFRPGRGCHTAITQALNYVNAWYTFVAEELLSHQGYGAKAKTANYVMRNDLLKAQGWTWIDQFRDTKLAKI